MASDQIQIAAVLQQVFAPQANLVMTDADILNHVEVVSSAVQAQGFPQAIVGVHGGFNPVHNAHTTAFKLAVEQMRAEINKPELVKGAGTGKTPPKGKGKGPGKDQIVAQQPAEPLFPTALPAGHELANPEKEPIWAIIGTYSDGEMRKKLRDGMRKGADNFLPAPQRVELLKRTFYTAQNTAEQMIFIDTHVQDSYSGAMVSPIVAILGALSSADQTLQSIKDALLIKGLPEKIQDPVEIAIQRARDTLQLGERAQWLQSELQQLPRADPKGIDRYAPNRVRFFQGSDYEMYRGNGITIPTIPAEAMGFQLPEESKETKISATDVRKALRSNVGQHAMLMAVLAPQSRAYLRELADVSFNVLTDVEVWEGATEMLPNRDFGALLEML